MNQSPKYLIKILEKNGFVFKRSKGSHQLYSTQQQIKPLSFLYTEVRT
jgi:predicted RNA binding protein YcfA (HicA-like mRNA interferase family)